MVNRRNEIGQPPLCKAFKNAYEDQTMSHTASNILVGLLVVVPLIYQHKWSHISIIRV